MAYLMPGREVRSKSPEEIVIRKREMALTRNSVKNCMLQSLNEPNKPHRAQLKKGHESDVEHESLPAAISPRRAKAELNAGTGIWSRFENGTLCGR